MKIVSSRAGGPGFIITPSERSPMTTYLGEKALSGRSRCGEVANGAVVHLGLGVNVGSMLVLRKTGPIRPGDSTSRCQTPPTGLAPTVPNQCIAGGASVGCAMFCPKSVPAGPSFSVLPFAKQAARAGLW